MKKYQLGEFEEIVLLTIAILYKGAYGGQSFENTFADVRLDLRCLHLVGI